MLRMLFRRLKQARAINRDPIGYARSLGVHIGEKCRILGLTSATFGSEPFLITIGDHVEITSGVRFVTHDGGVWVFREEYPEIDVVAPIVVGDNVFIGINSIILPGVIIGDNCVIGAGSVVTKSIPSGSVAAGVPARVLDTIENYHAKVQGRSMKIRHLPWLEKRAILIERFMRK